MRGLLSLIHISTWEEASTEMPVTYPLSPAAGVSGVGSGVGVGVGVGSGSGVPGEVRIAVKVSLSQSTVAPNCSETKRRGTMVLSRPSHLTTPASTPPGSSMALSLIHI